MQFNESGADPSVPLEEVGLLPAEIAALAAAASTGPEASSTAPSREGTTSAAADQPGDPLPEFDERHREEFSGLMFLGALSKKFSWAGHRFQIRTLTSGELLEVGLLQKAYRDTIADSRAYVTCLVAACVVLVDGKALPQPLGPGESALDVRVRFVLDNWYTWTVDAVYEEYLLLEARVNDILAAMGKAQPSVRSTAG